MELYKSTQYNNEEVVRVETGENCFTYIIPRTCKELIALYKEVFDKMKDFSLERADLVFMDGIHSSSVSIYKKMFYYYYRNDNHCYYIATQLHSTQYVETEYHIDSNLLVFNKVQKNIPLIYIHLLNSILYHFDSPVQLDGTIETGKVEDYYGEPKKKKELFYSGTFNRGNGYRKMHAIIPKSIDLTGENLNNIRLLLDTINISTEMIYKYDGYLTNYSYNQQQYIKRNGSYAYVPIGVLGSDLGFEIVRQHIMQRKYISESIILNYLNQEQIRALRGIIRMLRLKGNENNITMRNLEEADKFLSEQIIEPISEAV